MSRFRSIVVGAVILAGCVTIVYRWNTPLPPRIEPPQHETRGLKDPEDARRAAWLREIQARDIAQANAAMITLDNDIIIGVSAMMAALTGIFSLLSKYLIGPMIDRKLTDYSEKLNTSLDSRMGELVTVRQFDEYKEHDIADHQRLEKQINAIWGKVK